MIGDLQHRRLTLLGLLLAALVIVAPGASNRPVKDRLGQGCSDAFAGDDSWHPDYSVAPGFDRELARWSVAPGSQATVQDARTGARWVLGAQGGGPGDLESPASLSGHVAFELRRGTSAAPSGPRRGMPRALRRLLLHPLRVVAVQPRDGEAILVLGLDPTGAVLESAVTLRQSDSSLRIEGFEAGFPGSSHLSFTLDLQLQSTLPEGSR